MYADPGRIQPVSAGFSQLRSDSISPYCPPVDSCAAPSWRPRSVTPQMLSGWQTVAISLGASTLTGAAALLGAWIRGRQDRAQLDRRLEHERTQQERQLEHERAEQWRDRLVRAADDFSTGAQQALLAVHQALQAVSGARGDPHATVAEADRVVGEAIARVGHVKLLFGEGSEPANRAEDLVRQLEHTLTYARDGKETIEAWDRLAWNQLDKAYAKHRDFNRDALEMISR
jgi:hypothetical protein